MPPEYLLFLDTETTGLPGRWDLPYEAPKAAWPYVAQVAWQVYTSGGQLVKEASHYLRIPAGSMQASALAVHGLSEAFLQEHGHESAQVLQLLLSDLQRFRPRVVGYFLQLDFHVLGAGLHRAGLPNPLPELPQFCLMRAAPRPDDGTHRRYQRLAELHETLFREPMPVLHDARQDAVATARCFFELRRRGHIPPETLTGQLPLQKPVGRPHGAGGRWLLAVVAGALLLLLLGWLFYG
ncbi:3'-5' exonuclease [Hymenobacter psychrotolerans]|uniref:DNA polymerase-3 subunit epsilon n=1 Tax=Hymenobacter psychrotolerans DSM 18569 TaxID=1121959 RepID=A0A1M6UHD8_9BACT|nr:3'-5' exonuclease [Hymenobacter psychrotolerans]SHK68586.1 DNA polymerase-3 subunit epsilon [Hymenobacter psychrotolerans DSM 18569]